MKIAIIGGGISGLTLAYRFSKLNHEVTLFEKENYLGGLASTIKFGSVELERYYHHIFTTDFEIIKLLQELKIDKNLRWHKTCNALYSSKYYDFNYPWDILSYDKLSLINRFKLGFLTLKARGVKDYKQLNNVTAKDWIIKNSSKSIYDNFWKPTLKSKFEKDSESISAAWIVNKIKLRSKSRESLFSSETFGYLNGSFSILINKLKNEIVKHGGIIKIKTPILGIRKCQNKLLLNKILYDKVIFTGSNEDFSKLYPPFSTIYKNRLYKIDNMANICLILELKKPFSKYYWTSILEPQWPFLALIEQTNMIKYPRYHNHLLYVSRYLSPNSSFFKLSDNEIKNIFIKYLNQMKSQFKKNEIINTRVYRSLNTQPVIKTNYQKDILDFRTPLKGLYLLNMTQIYPEDRGLNYAIKYANKLANEILDNEKY